MKAILIMGGLGNQMFQYALYLAHYMKYDDLKCDLSWYNKNKIHNGFELENIFKIKELKITEETFFTNSKIRNFFQKIKIKIKASNIIQDDYSYKENIFKEKKIKSFYMGYWQSEKYFKNIENKIREAYKFPEINDEKNLKIIQKMQYKQTVSIHVRRGDYVGHPQLDGMAPVEYYKNAINYIKNQIKNPVFLVFSNDMEWCKKSLNLSKGEVEYIDWNLKEDSYKDMQLMSMCKHNIIPNSSFSWWGAWLNKNPNKIVIAPEKWFTNKSKLKYDDIVPDSWIKIKNY